LGCIDELLGIQRGASNIVYNTHGEVVLRSGCSQVIEDSLGHGWCELLGTQAITAADDHYIGLAILAENRDDILVEGLKLILGKEEDIEICGTASNGRKAHEACKWNRPDVVLMDIKMPEVNGVEATEMIKRDFPEVRIIVLTTFNDDEYIYEALKHGASGYLLKDTSPSEIAAAVRTVYNGGALIQSEVAVKVLDKFSELAKGNVQRHSDPRVELLTEREIDICRLIAEGKNNMEIAESLYLSEGTVKNHITRVLIKLDLRDRTQLAVFTIKNDL
jgi:DNA-binding NarL/FixJ family response regulator